MTRDFGHERLGTARLDKIGEADTVMRLLRRNFDVRTRYGGRFVQAIEGAVGKGAAGRGLVLLRERLRGERGSRRVRALAGRRRALGLPQLEGRDAGAGHRGRVPRAVPPRAGGQALPGAGGVSDESSRACTTVKDRLGQRRACPLPARRWARPVPAGCCEWWWPWEQAKIVTTVAELEKGLEESGVFARIDGGQLELLGSDGEVERRAPAGTGLVAAFAPSEEDTVWAVTGLDERGVEAAARALDRRRCATPTR